VSKDSSGYSICKVGLDGKGESTVWSASGNPQLPTLNWLNVVGDEAYFETYSSLTKVSSICKVGTDGTDEKSIWYTTNGTWPIYLDVADDNIYFTELGKSSLYRIDTDGKNEMTI
jgi:hypothetical protein